VWDVDSSKSLLVREEPTWSPTLKWDFWAFSEVFFSLLLYSVQLFSLLCLYLNLWNAFIWNSCMYQWCVVHNSRCSWLPSPCFRENLLGVLHSNEMPGHFLRFGIDARCFYVICMHTAWELFFMTDLERCLGLFAIFLTAQVILLRWSSFYWDSAK